MYTNDERIEMLEDAQKLLFEAIELIRDAVKGTRVEKGCDAYVLAELQMCATEEHMYMGRQFYNLDELIRSFTEDSEE